MEDNHSIITHEDPLVQILSRLPKTSLHCFKSVSKEWHALISSSHHFPSLSSNSGFLLQTPLSRSSLLTTFLHLHPHGFCVSPPNSLLFLFRSNSNSLSVRSSLRPFLPSSSSLFPSQPPSFFVTASSNDFLLLRSLLFATASFHIYQPSSNLLLSLLPPPTNPPLHPLSSILQPKDKPITISSSSPFAATHLETLTSSSTSSPPPPKRDRRRQCAPSPLTSLPPLPSSSAATCTGCGGSICSSSALLTIIIRSWSSLSSSSMSFIMDRHSPLPLLVQYQYQQSSLHLGIRRISALL